VPHVFEDGPALWETVREHELEGVVAKRLHEPYMPAERRCANRLMSRCDAKPLRALGLSYLGPGDKTRR
jgi:hypothetical protein